MARFFPNKGVGEFPILTVCHYSFLGGPRVDDENCLCTWEGSNVQIVVSSSSTGAVVHYLPFCSERPPLVHPHLHHFQLCCSRERKFAASIQPQALLQETAASSLMFAARTALGPSLCCSQMGTTRPCSPPTGEQERQHHLAEAPPPESFRNIIPRAGKEGPLGTGLESNRKHPRFPGK